MCIIVFDKPVRPQGERHRQLEFLRHEHGGRRRARQSRRTAGLGRQSSPSSSRTRVSCRVRSGSCQYSCKAVGLTWAIDSEFHARHDSRGRRPDRTFLARCVAKVVQWGRARENAVDGSVTSVVGRGRCHDLRYDATGVVRLIRRLLEAYLRRPPNPTQRDLRGSRWLSEPAGSLTSKDQSLVARRWRRWPRASCLCLTGRRT